MLISLTGKTCSNVTYPKKDGERATNPGEFWGQVYCAWCEFTFYQPQNLEEILSEILRNNSHIELDGKFLFWKKCIFKGMNFTRDIYDCNTDSGLLSFDSLIAKFGCTLSWLEYESLKKCIPPEWKAQLRSKTLVATDRIHPLEKFEGLKVSKHVYQELINMDDVVVKYAERWYCKHDIVIDVTDYKKGFQLAHKTVDVTKYKDFQYRLLLMKIPTNVDLFEWKLKQTICVLFVKTSEKPWSICLLNVYLSNVFGNMWQNVYKLIIWSLI